MKYVNREMKIDQIIGYFNAKKINLIPPFQRGTVWPLTLRKKLIENMVQARPIPAIFLYKQDAGAQFEYNILDGKQRLESLILFVGDQRGDMKVKNIAHYFFGKPASADTNFAITLEGHTVTFKGLEDHLVRTLREYPIPTIEIDLDDEDASFDEVVNLFVDINQKGVKVSRFDVVKALGSDPLFKQVFGLVARRELKKKSSYYKAMNNSFVNVMKHLNIVSRLSDKNSQVDRMWERLTEIALFSRNNQHREPARILKAFINPGTEKNKRLRDSELTKLRGAFGFLAGAYRATPALTNTKLATDQPQFYTLITSLLSADLMDRYDSAELSKRILAVARMIDGTASTPNSLKKVIESYKQAATKQTTQTRSRETRQDMLVKAITQVRVQ